MRELHHEIVRRTDEIYVALEDVPTQQGARSMHEVFERALRALARQVAEAAQSKEMELSFGAPKDPVRIVEKAEDDYAANFSDGVAAEACVVDVLRARGVCSRPEDLLLTQTTLLDPKGVALVDEELSITVRFEVVRVKSKFGSDRDPTHFRNLLNNLRMTVTCSDGTVRTSFVELQLHEKGILAHNNESKAHDHYDYFRSLLEGSYDSDLDKFLERTILVRACHRRLPHPRQPAVASTHWHTLAYTHKPVSVSRPLFACSFYKRLPAIPCYYRCWCYCLARQTTRRPPTPCQPTGTSSTCWCCPRW